MARELYRCTVCDSDIEKKGRYGHIKFSDGDGHGPKGEVPEDAENYFIQVDEDAREQAKEDAEESEGNGGDETESSDDSPNPEGNDDSESSKSADETESSDGPEDDGNDSGNGNPPEPTETGDETEDKRSLKELLTTPINELL